MPSEPPSHTPWTGILPVLRRAAGFLLLEREAG
jgi:hypothetical protein